MFAFTESGNVRTKVPSEFANVLAVVESNVPGLRTLRSELKDVGFKVTVGRCSGFATVVLVID